MTPDPQTATPAPPDPTAAPREEASPREPAGASSPASAQAPQTQTAQTEPAQTAQAEPAQAARPEPAETAVVTVPDTRRQESRPSFWQRIGLRSNRLAAATPDDRLLSRLDAIESRLEASAQEIGDRIRTLDERFSEVWEVEEQLSRMAELRDLLQDMRDRQGRVDGRLRGIERRLSFVTLLAAVAAGAALVAVALAWL